MTPGASAPAEEAAVRWHDGSGLVELTGRPAGPAGAIALEVGPVHVRFDVAEPTAVLGLVMPWHVGADSHQPAVREALALTVGGVQADALLGRARARRNGDEDRRRVRAAPLGTSTTALAATGLARAELQRPGRTLVQRLAAHLDAALHASQVPLGDRSWIERRVDDAALAAELAFAVSFDEAEELQVLTAGRLAGALRTLADLGVVELPRAQELRRLASRLRRTHPGDEGSTAPELLDEPGEPPPPPPARPPLAAVPETAVQDARPEVSPESLPGAIAGGPLPLAHRPTPDEVLVRVPGWGERAAGWWARAFRAGTDVPVAAAPLHAAAGGAEALLLVPAVDGPAEIDVVERVAAPRPPRPLAATWVAQSWGGAAARAERLGHVWAAESRWSTCADWHDRAGDTRRATQARALAPHDPGRRTPVLLLGDVLEH